MNKKFLIAVFFILAMLATMKTLAQTTDFTIYYRSNSSTDVIHDVNKFYFEGGNIVFELGNGSTESLSMAEIEKMTLTYNEPDNTEIDGSVVESGIYPNPVSDALNFNFVNGETARIQIFSSDGQLIKSETIQSDHPIDVSALQEGLYIIKINDKTYKFSKL